MAKGYDVKCGELATLFLEDKYGVPPVGSVDGLAQAIQDAIEDWMRFDDELAGPKVADSTPAIQTERESRRKP